VSTGINLFFDISDPLKPKLTGVSDIQFSYAKTSSDPEKILTYEDNFLTITVGNDSDFATWEWKLGGDSVPNNATNVLNLNLFKFIYDNNKPYFAGSIVNLTLKVSTVGGQWYSASLPIHFIQ
jgi:hypothetical protein